MAINLCVVLRSPKKADTYLYLPKDADFDALPEALQTLFTPQHIAMNLLVKPERKYARLTGAELLAHFNEPGYFLQLPPAHDSLLPIASPEYTAHISKK
ncbi:YcgL domain-containing protein [Aliidiomarina quisquiliarum]|uniref:YcgL domain-containing protein n=1 Tax=Aliidiomarina quisquiliarum TaxID=2938947 RepID=UPI00208FE086|nr:YcgL domain-containing protein [Aliidiomarina quisquiliarum]MCO4320179.1 YcgL domain-containing protein [Aliidiomarina quisquiliarum]